MQNIGEIKLFTYDNVPDGYLQCKGQSLKINDYPKLYMLIGAKYGKADEQHFNLPNLIENAPTQMMYCIAVVGEIPKL